MSILLSAYYPEGIVFAADKNATIYYGTPTGVRKHVEPTATKVLTWPYHRAIIGFVGLGRLGGLDLDEWVRIFISETRDFDDIDVMAQNLRDRVQQDFDKSYPTVSDMPQMPLVIHLGGFAIRSSVQTPVMYHIWNHENIDPNTGAYSPGERDFRISEDIERDFRSWKNPEDYPARVRNRLERMINEERFYWFNNGANLGAFNIFKAVTWQALRTAQKRNFVPELQGLAGRVAFCKMAVEVFGSVFTQFYTPEERAVGGGVDAVYIPWP